jgi:hypothetical protein
MVGLIAKALELHVERPINIFGMYQWKQPISSILLFSARASIPFPLF